MGWDGAKAKPGARMESGHTRLSGTEQSRNEQSGADTVRNPQHVCVFGLLHTDEPLSFAFHHHRSSLWKL